MKKASKILVSTMLLLIIMSVLIACSPMTYTVKFDLKGGTGTIASQQVKKGEKATRPTVIPTKTGTVFINWYDADTAEANIFDFDKPIEKNITVYARYSVENLQITYVLGENATGVEDTEVAYGGKLTRPATDPTRPGYRFTGWFTGADMATEFDFDASLTAATSVYAGWESEGSVLFGAIDKVLDGNFTAVVNGSESNGSETTSYEGMELRFVPQGDDFGIYMTESGSEYYLSGAYLYSTRPNVIDEEDEDEGEEGEEPDEIRLGRAGINRNTDRTARRNRRGARAIDSTRSGRNLNPATATDRTARMGRSARMDREAGRNMSRGMGSEAGRNVRGIKNTRYDLSNNNINNNRNNNVNNINNINRINEGEGEPTTTRSAERLYPYGGTGIGSNEIREYFTSLKTRSIDEYEISKLFTAATTANGMTFTMDVDFASVLTALSLRLAEADENTTLTSVLAQTANDINEKLNGVLGSNVTAGQVKTMLDESKNKSVGQLLSSLGVDTNALKLVSAIQNLKNPSAMGGNNMLDITLGELYAEFLGGEESYEDFVGRAHTDAIGEVLSQDIRDMIDNMTADEISVLVKITLNNQDDISRIELRIRGKIDADNTAEPEENETISFRNRTINNGRNATNRVNSADSDNNSSLSNNSDLARTRDRANDRRYRNTDGNMGSRRDMAGRRNNRNGEYSEDNMSGNLPLLDSTVVEPIQPDNDIFARSNRADNTRNNRNTRNTRNGNGNNGSINNPVGATDNGAISNDSSLINNDNSTARNLNMRNRGIADRDIRGIDAARSGRGVGGRRGNNINDNRNINNINGIGNRNVNRNRNNNVNMGDAIYLPEPMTTENEFSVDYTLDLDISISNIGSTEIEYDTTAIHKASRISFAVNSTDEFSADINIFGGTMFTSEDLTLEGLSWSGESGDHMAEEEYLKQNITVDGAKVSLSQEALEHIRDAGISSASFRAGETEIRFTFDFPSSESVFIRPFSAQIA